jgi:hypothetical protein
MADLGLHRLDRGDKPLIPAIHSVTSEANVARMVAHTKSRRSQTPPQRFRRSGADVPECIFNGELQTNRKGS